MKDFDVLPIRSLSEAVAFFRGETKIIPVQTSQSELDKNLEFFDEIDFADVKGQSNVKRAVEVAVAGGHNLLIIGPPGSGKSMIAKRIPSILPDPSHEEFLEILNIHSAAGNFILKSLDSNGIIYPKFQLQIISYILKIIPFKLMRYLKY